MSPAELWKRHLCISMACLPGSAPADVPEHGVSGHCMMHLDAHLRPDLVLETPHRNLQAPGV